MGEIVVGVDGSAGGNAALAWAATEATLRGVTLRAVCVLKSPASWMGMGEALGSGVAVNVSDEDLEQVALDTIADAIASVGIGDELTIVRDGRVGRAATVLVALSAEADLVVVGACGHGDVGSVLLGSVAMHCTHHARCPVTVVPSALAT